MVADVMVSVEFGEAQQEVGTGDVDILCRRFFAGSKSVRMQIGEFVEAFIMCRFALKWSVVA